MRKRNTKKDISLFIGIDDVTNTGGTIKKSSGKFNMPLVEFSLNEGALSPIKGISYFFDHVVIVKSTIKIVNKRLFIAL